MNFDKQYTEKLILELQSGNNNAYETFYNEWYPNAYYIALAIVHNEADAKDVAQETMIQIHNSIKDLRDPGYFKLWLNRIVLSKCNRIFRKRKASLLTETQIDVLNNQNEERDYFLPINQTHYQSDQQVLMQILHGLKPVFREVLAMMYFEQLSIKEIAEILKVPEGTVKSRLSTAKAKVRKEIEAYEKETGIALNFHTAGLDAAIIAAYFAFVKPEGLSFVVPKQGMDLPVSNKNILPALQTSSILSNLTIGFLSAIVLTSGFLAYQEYQKPQETASPNVSLEQPSLRNESFQPSQFKDITITNAKDAYYVLMKYGHCDYELEQLSSEEKTFIENLRYQLKNSSEIYDNLYEINKK